MVGDFDSNILPLFFHNVENIRVHVLLVDKRYSDERHAVQIARGIDAFCNYYDYKPTLLQISFDEDSVESIEEIYLQINKLAKTGEKIYFNVSDGLASTLAVLHPLIQRDNGIILSYDRFENTCNIVEGRNMTKEVISPMSIHEHLMLKNIAYEFPDHHEIVQRKEVVFDLMENMKTFTEFKISYQRQEDLTPYKSITEKLEMIDHPNIQFFIHGGILEEYCYWLVKDLGFDDVKIGSKVTVNAVGARFKNELDVLMIKDNHLHMIECKYKTSSTPSESFVYKSHSIQNTLDADANATIVSVGEKKSGTPSNGNKRVQFGKGTKNRAQYNRIYIFHEEVLEPKYFQEKVKRFFLA